MAVQLEYDSRHSDFSLSSEAAVFSAEDFSDSLVETKHDNPTKKIVEVLLIAFGIA
jgi:hypothetical protein